MIYMMIIHTDGACFGNPGPMGIGVAIYRGGKLSHTISEYIGKGTNNIAEYTAVLRAIGLAKELGESEIEIRSDSLLIIKQMKGEYKARMPHLAELRDRIHALAKGMRIQYKWVPREQNAAADELSKNAIESKV